MSENNCIFCKILAGSSPVSMVYQDDLVSAFMDIQPVNAGHVLVVPNKHGTHLADVEPKTGGRLFQVGQRVAQALRESGLKCEGVNFFVADGVAAGQEVFHVHLHVFPRYEGDGFGLRHPQKYFDLPARAELDSAAVAIKHHLVK